MYEVPVKIYNISKKTKSVNIKHPNGFFKVDTDKKNKRTQIPPGLHLELIVIFETEQNITEDQFDEIVITSENDFKLILPLKAYLPQPLIQFEPLINLGFVPIGTRKIDTIQFINDGILGTKIQLKLDKNDDLKLDTDNIYLPPYKSKVPEDKRKAIVSIYFEPTTTQNLHEKIEVIQEVGKKSLGFIEVIATSVVQQMSIVFEEGGGPQTDINFGLLYYGQKKECSAFLVNNGPKEMNFKFFFHPNKSRKDFHDNFEDNFASTPEEAGIEMTQRILSAEPMQGKVEAYTQIPIKFLCSTKIKKEEKGWRVTLSPDYDINNSNRAVNLRDKLNKVEHFESLAAIKFEETFINKLAEKDTDEEFCKTISVYMEVKAIHPNITIDKTSLNFWECNIKERKVISITITNRNEELPIDFNFLKIPHFSVIPNKGVIRPTYDLKEPSQFTVNVYFHPENLGKFNDILIMKYVNGMYEIPIRIFGICKGSTKLNVNLNKKFGKTLPIIDSYSINKSKTKRFLENKSNSTNYIFGQTQAIKVPDELAQDFTKKTYRRIDPNLRIKKFHQNLFNELLSKMKKNNDIKSSIEKGFNPSSEIINNFEKNFQVYRDIYNHKSIANEELSKMRRERQLKKQRTLLAILNRTRSKENSPDQDSEKDNYKTKSYLGFHNKTSSVDDLSKLVGNRLVSPMLKLPVPQDNLWVVKPIGKYEPLYLEENTQKSIGKTPDDIPESFDLTKKDKETITGEIPRTHQEIRECNLELKGEDLQKIQVGCKELKMGQVFKNSEKAKTFWIKNNHRNYIFVKLDIDSNNLPDLQKSYPKSHVIAPGEMQGFRIVIFSSVVRKSVYSVKYTINYKHSFKLKVLAEVILVKLEIQNIFNKFTFRNDKYEKDKVEMSVTQKLKLFNGGNAPAEIFWDNNREKAFSISPKKDIIMPRTEKEVTVVFNPFNSAIQRERYPDEFKLNIINGEPMTFPVEGVVSTCYVNFSGEGDTVNFDLVHTGVPSTKLFSLKNDSIRVVSAYQIQNPLPDILTFKEPSGYLTDKVKTILVTINHKEPNPEFYCEVPILIRGGKPLTLKIMATIMQPEVIIEQEIFDFGGVSFNEQSTKLLTFNNKSHLPANVIINLNSDSRYKDFKLIFQEKEKEKGVIIKPLEKEKNEENFEEEEESEEESKNEEDENEKTNEKEEELRYFMVTIPKEETANFDFIFWPNSFETDEFDFQTNFELVGASEEYKGLKRRIIGKKIDSVVTVSDMVVKFPKTFIYENTNNVQRKEIKIGSVQQNKSLKWEFIIPEEMVKEGVFKIVNKKGEIPPDSDIFVSVEITFAPKAQKEYSQQVILHVVDEEGTNTNKVIKLEGEGFYPRIYFDRRELILPIVPLGWESSIKFKIKNEGYENEEINAEFESYPQGALPIKLIWSENTHNIGLVKNDLKLEIKFMSLKPLSFTTKLVFYDREGKQYPIYVAGTTDNCIFTNFTFFQRTDVKSYEINYDRDNKSINVKKKKIDNELSQKENEKNGEENSNKNNNSNNSSKNNNKNLEKKSDKNSSSYGGSSQAKNSIGLLGYNKISNAVLDLNCKMIKKYIKNIHLDENYRQNNVFKVFPDDVVKDNGKVIYILIKNFIGKEPPGRITILETDINKKAIQLREQYGQLIRFLQECGALLNTVFPEYLLDFALYKKYISLDKNKVKVLDSKWEKAKSLPAQWRYYHKQSWILIVYQILKIFYLSRVNLKSLPQALKHLSSDIQSRYMIQRFPQSNIYSQAELILLRWVSACFEYVNPNMNKDIYNFSKDFSDSSALSAVLLSYFPNEEKNYLKKRFKADDYKSISYSNIFNILKEYGIFTHIKNFQKSPTNNPNAREMILLLTMLYQNFQYFYPKDTIQFTCTLGDTVVKSITLMNPTNKFLEYAIKHEGNECFIFPNINEIKIEPGKEIDYQITFKSKFSNKTEGKVYFINKKSGWASQAAPIVYNLVSNITGRRSIDYKIISTNLYSQFAYKLQVKNPFPKEKGEYEVFLEQKKKIVQQKKKGGVKSLSSKNTTNELLYRVFMLKGEQDGKSTIKFINQDGTSEITIYFLPIELETYECNVIFLKENVGEFQYTIEGRVEKPQAKKTEIIEETCNVDELKDFYIEVNLDNVYLKKALDSLKPMKDAMINGKPANMKMIAQKYSPSSDKLTFAVESNKNYYMVPPTIYPGSIPEPTAHRRGSIAVAPVKKNIMWLKVKFQSKSCMIYEGDIYLTNMDKPNDIRVYRLYVDVKPKDIKATLEFYCPLKEKITQKIPIENKSDKDWIIQTDITGDSHGFFSIVPDKRILKKSVTDILLTFAPTEKRTSNAMLKLFNNFTGEKYFYTLIGNVEDPLAEDNIEITNINAKETQKKYINFNNESENDITYTVETDLDEIVSGLSSFVVKANSTYSYEMKIRPLLGKIYFGRIIFKDENKGYIWYTIRIEAKSQIQPKTIEMRTVIRKGVFVDINLENPTDEDAIFRIDFDQDLFLFGEKDVRVPANSKIGYRLLYAPLKVGTWDNVMLHIYNDKIGEYLYKLLLICESCPIVSSEIIKAELGKYVDFPVMLENPTGEEVEVRYTNTNKKLFQVLQEKIYIPGGIRKEILIRYIPSTIETIEECNIKFETKRIGNWEFYLRGMGIPPTQMETLYAHTYVGGVTTGQINFKNPLNEKVFVTIELKCDKFPDAFSLLNKKNKYLLEPGRMIIIPFTFKPQILTKYSANIFVHVSKTLFWDYPIEGITEVKSKGIDFVFKTKAKKMFETKLNLDISNLPEKVIDYTDFVYMINVQDEKLKDLINKCLTIQFMDKNKLDQIDLTNRKLPLQVKFYPLRPIKTEIEFILRKKSGGQWIYNILLESTEPEPDDIINIKSSIGKQSFVTFRLQNIFTKDAKFSAYFTHESSNEFSVTPKEGILDQSGREGTQFVVCYLPVEYGKMKMGKLIIETDEVQWVFEVRGSHLDYRPPEIKKSHFLEQTKSSGFKTVNMGFGTGGK